ncbi:RNA polymerase, sigma-24 subunit, ECF subfamily [Anaeromyxobacter dehalogenans 2CP-1]|uniref:RNA polymerase, sigma-24 subunit, ECF subfamily n=1 Tax=Anaeromyxobacter dehalogenans (strain ATCC BAA-258 / DSM 21875 / 2CP-1) TaxID=455488 RepID=B8J532_ANAD2|nr:sigma-70 family RNA polymerase sigma factor [Anaeromyxobacter dehalogenans]ACL64887.1 RNA polymerase, sigma-24 subunit, ECF subfamily [Anaeromyxobacter dehalogenans 2CP-1]
MTAQRKPEGGEDAGAADAADVAAALRGDRAAQRALYDRYRPAVHRLARSFPALDADDAEDVVQDAFVRAFASLARLEQPARFGGWLLTIARNRAITRIARGRARSQLAEELGREAEALGAGEAEAPDPEAGAELELVRRVVDELPEGPEKETVRLFYLEGQLTAREIAARLGVGKSAITMRLERFRAKVKRRLLAEVARLRGEES